MIQTLEISAFVYYFCHLFCIAY